MCFLTDLYFFKFVAIIAFNNVNMYLSEASTFHKNVLASDKIVYH